jgi:peptidoglycan/LPS O-acetylase OafA/YrhL
MNWNCPLKVRSSSRIFMQMLLNFTSIMWNFLKVDINYGRFAFCLQFDGNVSMMIIFNASLATDTFLLLSGTVLAYSFMSVWDKKTSFNIATFYIHRYLR